MLQNYLGSLISLAVMPSQFIYSEETGQDVRLHYFKLYNNPFVNQFSEPPVNITNQTFQSTNQAQLDACEVRPSDMNSSQPKKVIIHAMGNGDIYEAHFNEFIDESKKHNAIVVGFNFRNVVKSKGDIRSENDLIDDVIAVVDHYRNEGIKVENILLNGHSLGAAILTMAAARIHALDKLKAVDSASDNVPSVKLINSRSFSTLAEVVAISLLGGVGSGFIIGLLIGVPLTATFSMMAGLTGLAICSSVGLLKPTLPQTFLTAMLDKILKSTFGRMDALSAYKALPEDIKEHIVAKDDGIVKIKASLHHGLKYKKTELKEMIAIAKSNHDIEEVKRLEKILLNLKDSKVQLSPQGNKGFEAHNTPLGFLNTFHRLRGTEQAPQITGQQVMDDKINRLMNKP